MVGIISELRQRMEEQGRLKEDLANRHDGTMKVLTGVRAGLEHVAEKLEASCVMIVSRVNLPCNRLLEEAVTKWLMYTSGDGLVPLYIYIFYSLAMGSFYFLHWKFLFSHFSAFYPWCFADP